MPGAVCGSPVARLWIHFLGPPRALPLGGDVGSVETEREGGHRIKRGDEREEGEEKEEGA